MGFISKFLSNPVGNNLQNVPPDVRNTKTYLSQLGYFEDDTDNDFITRELDTSIRDFQRDMNLRVDGRLFPGGETEENTLFQREIFLPFGTETTHDLDKDLPLDDNGLDIPQWRRYPSHHDLFDDNIHHAIAWNSDFVKEDPIQTMPAYDDDHDTPNIRTMEKRDFDPYKDSLDGSARPLIELLPGFQESRRYDTDNNVVRDPFGTAVENFNPQNPIQDNRDNDPDDVIGLQRILGSLGLISGDALHDPTGVLDHETVDGVKRFQNMMGLKVDGIVTPDGETAQGLRAVGSVARYNTITGASPEEEKEVADRQRAYIVGQAASMIKGILDAVRGEGSTGDKLKAFAPIVSMGLGALAGVPGLADISNIASQGFSAATSAFGIKDALESDGNVLEKINEILPAAVSGVGSAVGLAGSIGNALGSAGTGIGEGLDDLLGSDSVAQTGMSTGNATKGMGTAKEPTNALLDQVRQRQDANAHSLAKTGRIPRSDDILFGGSGNDQLQESTPPTPEHKPVKYDATGRMIRDNETPPVPKRKPEVISPTHKGDQLLNFIGKLESSDNYNVIYGNEEKPLTKMTVKEVQALQQKMIDEGRGSSAVGRYQFLKGTLKEAVDKLGIDEDTIFDEKLQDRLARSRLEFRGFEKYKAGKISTETLIKGLANEWAALPPDASNKSRHDGILNNKALTDFKTLKDLLEKK